MEMDGLDCAKCQNSEKRTRMVYESLMSMRQKMNSVIFSKNIANGQWLDGCAVYARFDFLERERESTFFIYFRPIGALVFDGARSKVALRGEDYAWAPIWWSSDNSKR